VDLGKLSNDEKSFIDNRVLLYRKNGKIQWSSLRKDLKARYGRLRSGNMVKNYYYAKRRSAVLLPIPRYDDFTYQRLQQNHPSTLQCSFKPNELKLPFTL